MAMNKKEQAYIKDLEDQLRLAKAMRFTIKISPDVMPPAFENGKELRKGWLFNTYSRTVERGCTCSLYHSFGTDEEARSQNPMPLYSTKRLALMALRNRVEIELARELAQIDEAIEDEK